jgi:hypothetical protein
VVHQRRERQVGERERAVVRKEHGAGSGVCINDGADGGQVRPQLGGHQCVFGGDDGTLLCSVVRRLRHLALLFALLRTRRTHLDTTTTTTTTTPTTTPPSLVARIDVSIPLL